MAQIDLKNAKIYIEDGYGATGAVNNVAGYAEAATTMAVDGLTAAVVADETFTIGDNEDDIYVIVSSVGGATPTSITFTPGLTEAVADDDAINIRPHSVEIDVGDGTLTFEEK